MHTLALLLQAAPSAPVLSPEFGVKTILVGAATSAVFQVIKRASDTVDALPVGKKRLAVAGVVAAVAGVQALATGAPGSAAEVLTPALAQTVAGTLVALGTHWLLGAVRRKAP